MRIECEQLANSGRVAWNVDGDHPPDLLRALVGFGRGCVLHGKTTSLPVLIPLHGHVRVSEGGNVQRTLARGELFVAEIGKELQVVGQGAAVWLVLLANPALWRRLIGRSTDVLLPDPVLLPAVHGADREIRRVAVRLIRSASVGPSNDADAIAAALVFTDLLVDLQSDFEPLVGRCPGRTLSQRRNVFLRLKRVRNYMESDGNVDLGITGFARMANYSPCHFVRAFCAVYGETPHAVLVEQHLRRAHRLVNDTSLTISEIATVAGFEDRCAFARSFKRRFGQTATVVRAYGQGAGRDAA